MKTFTVQIYTNRIIADLSDYLTYTYQYYLKNGVTLHFDITAVNVEGYKSVLTPIAAGGNAYVLTGAENLVKLDTGHDITMFMFDLNEWKAPWYWPYPLRWDTPRCDCIMINNKPFINLGFYGIDPQGTKINMVHEPMHALTKIANISGFSIVDQMDTYIENNNPNSPTGNFAVQWKLLQPFLNPISYSMTKLTDITKFSLTPAVAEKAVTFLNTCAQQGYNLRITEGMRSMARQEQLYARGRTAPGKVVTNAQPGQSQHNFGKAFDVCFTGPIPYPTDDTKWKAIADIGKTLGLTPGYYFHSFQDKPHFEIA